VPEDYFSWFLIVFLAAVSQEFAFAEETTGTRARRSDVEESTWLCRELGRGFSAAELSVTLERLHRATRPVAGFFETYDLLLTPALASPPVRHGELHPRGLEATLQVLAARLGVGRYLRYEPLLRQAAERAFRFMPFSPIWNITGQPAASLPLHWTPDGRRSRASGRRASSSRLPRRWSRLVPGAIDCQRQSPSLADPSTCSVCPHRGSRWVCPDRALPVRQAISPATSVQKMVPL
jgi:hypothetical protein